MKNITQRFTICAVLLVACLLPISTHAKENRKHRESGIIGQIEQVPGAWDVRIIGQDGRLVADIQADDTGYFKVDLKPGTYTLTPFTPSIDGTGELVGVTATVTVEKKEFATVELFIVHGPD